MVEYQMSIPFAVKHKKAGYLIVVLVPLGWLFIIGQLERIRKALVLGLGLYALNILTSVLASIFMEESEDSLVIVGLVVIVISLVIHFWLWWHFYSKWVEEWEIKNP